MLARRILLWILLCSTGAVAQVRLPSELSRSDVLARRERQALTFPSAQGFHPRLASGDTVRVLAIMVDFQRDTDTLTTGDGRFQLVAPTSRMIDPPPHDSAYFAFKLQFLSNYFRKVSNGKVIAKGDVIGRVITLSNSMSAYSPPKGSSDFRPLANLVIESWRKADSLYPALQFSNYDAFALFHAGVGRDIDLVSALGYDPTPNDIPSVVVNLRTLREYLKDPTYSGIPVANGTFRITNTMILPATETRILSFGAQVDTLQGSINGLLANSFGSYLGLPDLFDTKDGWSGIGGFGLMDVAGGIYFYNGLFPPEPSAWEKVYLGWVTPVTVAPGTSVLSLPAVGLTRVGQDTIYKIPITDREYFLVENRNRDPEQNGQRLTVREGNFTITRTFADDVTGFNLGDVSAINGSVIDVEDLDWALPGYSVAGREYVGGGILIWHIDEDVIARGLVDNTVNADPRRRGVDLEEADGSQDIGRVYDVLEAGYGSEYGSPLDCWYAENPSPAYRNLFDGDSYPNSASNSGARSLVSVRNFSPRSPRMTLTVQIGNDRFRPLKSFARTLPSSGAPVPPTIVGSTIIVCAGNGVYAFRPDGSSKTQDASGLLSQKGGQHKVAAVDLGGGSAILVGAQDSSLYLWTIADRNSDGTIDSVQTIVVPLGERISAPPMVADVSVVRAVVVVGNRGTTWQVGLDGTVLRKSTISPDEVTSITQLPALSLSQPSEVFYATRDRLYSNQTSASLKDSSRPWILAGGISRFGNVVVAAQEGGKKVVMYDRSLAMRLIDFPVAEGTISSVAVADLDADGSGDIIVVAGPHVYALNRAGAVLDGFPIGAGVGQAFSGHPVIADVNSDGFLDILVLQSSGELNAFDRTGRRLDGFPLQFAGAGETSLGLFQTSEGKVGLVGSSRSGSLQALEVSTQYRAEEVAWSQFLADAQNSNYGGSTSIVVSPPTGLLPRSRVYNWPNPVYGSTTQIRYYTSEDAAITVKVFDLVGDAVAELKSHSTGGFDGEIAWDVSNIQSGVYLARVEAASANRTEVATIKIAVVK